VQEGEGTAHTLTRYLRLADRAVFWSLCLQDCSLKGYLQGLMQGSCGGDKLIHCTLISEQLHAK